MEMTKLNEIFPEWYTGTDGIFFFLDSLDVPWKDDLDSSYLDVAYMARSGEKYISPVVRNLKDKTGYKETLANTIFSLYGVNWVKLYETLSLEYNPIENYDMTETMTDDITEHEYHRKVTHTYNSVKDEIKGSENREISGGKVETTNTAQADETQTTKIKGFNSTGFQDSEQTVTSNPGGNVKTTQEQVTDGKNNLSYSNRYNERTGNETEEVSNVDGKADKDTRNYELTRSGNIGVTTTQQMLQQERELWIWNFFTDFVFPDIDKFLTIMVY